MRALIIAIFLFLQSCSTKNRDAVIDGADHADSVSLTLSNFVDDSLGCKGLRTKQSIEYIYSKGSLQGLNKVDLLKLLGRQNDSTTANGFINLRYYYNRACTSGIPIDSVERCWANINIEISTQKVTGLQFVCE
jgi:hypothetical protein